MPIFDQGYQHWRGALSGHWWRWITIARQGVRVQRQNRILRVLLLLAWLPALALVGVMILWGLVEQRSEGVLALAQSILPADVIQDPHAYRGTVWTLAFSFFFKAEIYVIMLLVAIAGPGLISQDLRFNALPLYLARPLTRLDYFLGKLGVIGALVLSVAVVPALFAYVVGLCFCFDLSVIRDTYKVLLGSVAYGLVITLSAGTLILALSSLTRRSLYVGIIWAGLWLISGTVAAILIEINRSSVRQEIQATEMNRWIDEHPPPSGTKFFIKRNGERYPQFQVKPGTRKPQLAGLRPEQEKEGERWFQAWSEVEAQAWEKAFREQDMAMRRDWRPMCSYVTNLERFADLLLDTDSAWVSIGRAVERAKQSAIGRGFGAARARRVEAELLRQRRGGRAPRELPASSERQFADERVLQYPWWWSAAVLLGLMGLSTCILTRRVKSLDRLR
jgi:ABC-2 type transport system permease protein